MAIISFNIKLSFPHKISNSKHLYIYMFKRPKEKRDKENNKVTKKKKKRYIGMRKIKGVCN